MDLKFMDLKIKIDTGCRFIRINDWKVICSHRADLETVMDGLMTEEKAISLLEKNQELLNNSGWTIVQSDAGVLKGIPTHKLDGVLPLEERRNIISRLEELTEEIRGAKRLLEEINVIKNDIKEIAHSVECAMEESTRQERVDLLRRAKKALAEVEAECRDAFSPSAIAMKAIAEENGVWADTEGILISCTVQEIKAMLGEA